MNDWLADSATLLYILLGTATVIFGLVWWRTRRGWFFVAACVLVLLIAALVLLRSTYPSEGEKIFGIVQDMSAALKAKDMDRIASHLANNFTWFGNSRAEFRKHAEHVVNFLEITECPVWDFEAEKVSRAEGKATIWFRAKPKSRRVESAAFYLIKADLVREPDGKWRMQTFDIRNPFVDINKSITPSEIPGF
jgi:ketosteroid isomerase-like protein